MQQSKQPFKLRKVAGSRYIHVEGLDYRGRLYRISTGETDLEAALHRAQQIHWQKCNEGAEPLFAAAAFSVWREYKQDVRRVSAATLEHVEKAMNVVNWLGLKFNLNDFDLKYLERYIVQRRKQTYGKYVQRPVCDETISKELKRFFEMLTYMARLKRYAWGEDQVEVFRTAANEVLAKSRPKTRVLKEEEFFLLWASLPEGRRDYLLAWVSVGARYGELERIHPKHVDFSDGVKRIYLTGHKGSIEHQERWIPVKDSAFEMFRRRAEKSNGGPLFEVWENSNANHMFARHCRKLGIEPVTVNDLRRTFATWHAKRKTPALDIKKMLGHSPRSRMLEQVYSQMTAESSQESAATFPEPPTFSGMSADEVEQTGNLLRPARFWKQPDSLRVQWRTITKEALQELFDIHHNARPIAEHFGVSQSLVSRKLREHGIRKPERLSKSVVVDALEACGRVRLAAQHLGVSVSTFRDAMNRHGVVWVPSWRGGSVRERRQEQPKFLDDIDE